MRIQIRNIELINRYVKCARNNLIECALSHSKNIRFHVESINLEAHQKLFVGAIQLFASHKRTKISCPNQ